MNNFNLQYPRTLFEWLKSDDKVLLAGIAGGQSVLEIAEDLGREHFSVLRRVDALGLYEFAEFSEEWVEFMGLALAGVPLQVVIDWCAAAPGRLAHDEIEGLAMGDLRPEFELARRLRIHVACVGAVSELGWLQSQPAVTQAGYDVAARSIIDALDIVTPQTLKNKVLGIEPPALVRAWPARSTTAKAPRAAKRRTSSKRYRRKSSAKSPTFRTYGETTGRGRARAARKAW